MESTAGANVKASPWDNGSKEPCPRTSFPFSSTQLGRVSSTYFFFVVSPKRRTKCFSQSLIEETAFFRAQAGSGPCGSTQGLSIASHRACHKVNGRPDWLQARKHAVRENFIPTWYLSKPLDRAQGWAQRVASSCSWPAAAKHRWSTIDIRLPTTQLVLSKATPSFPDCEQPVLFIFSGRQKGSFL